MAVSLDLNDSAYAAVERSLVRLASLIDFTYSTNGTNPTQSSNKHAYTGERSNPHPAVFKRLFRVLPHALGVFAFQDVDVVCIANMRQSTFWEYIDERLGSEFDPVPRIEEGCIVLEHTTLERHGIALPNALAMRLLFVPVSAVNYVDQQGRVVSQSTAATRESKSVQRLLELQRVSDQIGGHDASNRRIYLDCREMLIRLAIISPGFAHSLLSERSLQRILAPLTSSNQQGSNILNCLEQIRRVVRDPNKAELNTFVDRERLNLWFIDLVLTHMIEHGDINEPDLAAWTAFKSTYSTFIRITMNCWRLDQTSTAHASLCDAASRIHTHLRTRGGAMTWPHGDINDTSDGFSERSIILGCSATLDDLTLSSLTTATKFDDEHNSNSYQAYQISSQTMTHDEVENFQIKVSMPQITLYTDHADLNNGDYTDTHQTNHENDKRRFRTAAQVIQRLRHDPRLDFSSYELGYFDRFEPELIWKPLALWTRHTEDEDFVPEHRVRQIRRRSGRGVIWDRVSKTDLTDSQAASSH